MNVTITLDNVRKDVTVVPDGEGYTVTIDGREYRVSDVHGIEGALAFLVDRASYIAHISEGDGGTRLSLRGRHYRLVEEEMDVDRPGAGAAGGDGRVEAPMPGTIVAVRVAEGDRVTAGTPIAVLESMKMQNEIAAPVDGTVKRIHCRAGDQVGYGDVLAEVEAPKGDE